MNKYILLSLLILSSSLFAQSNTGFIIGDGVRIRTDGNAKSKEISKVHGMREVEIIEESKKWDDLGKDEICSRHKWIKVKWEGDSTGWVYGKYCYRTTGSEGWSTNKTKFDFNGSSYQILLYKNYEYPVGDEEGITGCNNTYRVYLYEEKTANYYFIRDTQSKNKDGETTLVLYSNDGFAESIEDIKVQGGKIILNVDISHQDGRSKSVYTIVSKNDSFEVIGYAQEEVKQ